jgi:hypothetical protein
MSEPQVTTQAPAAKQDQLVAKPAQASMIKKPSKKEIEEQEVRVFCLRAFELPKDEEGNTRVAEPGKIYSVKRKIARDLVKKLEGNYSFSGERHNADGDVTRHNVSRARLATASDMVADPHKALDSLDESEQFEREADAQRELA